MKERLMLYIEDLEDDYGIGRGTGCDFRHFHLVLIIKKIVFT